MNRGLPVASDSGNRAFLQIKGITSKLIQAQNIVNAFFLLSGVSATILLSARRPISTSLIGVSFSFLILAYLTFKSRFLDKITLGHSKIGLIVCGTFSLITNIYYMDLFYSLALPILQAKMPEYPDSEALCRGATLALGIAAQFSIFIFVNIFLTKATQSIRIWKARMDLVEKVFFLGASWLLIAFIALTYNATDAFYLPHFAGKIIDYDVIFSSDSGNIFRTNAFMNICAPENDLRQPLFGLFALPFAVFAFALSKLFFFLPNSAPISIASVQAVILVASLIMVVRMLNLQRTPKAIVLTLLTFSFPTLLFSLLIEQYIFCVFWLILFIYTYTSKSENAEQYIIPATGSLVTSAFLCALLSSGTTPRKKLFAFIREMLVFLGIMAMAGKLFLVINASVYANQYAGFTGTKLTFFDKLLQFLNFVRLNAVRPKSIVVTENLGFPSFQLAPVTSLSSMGAALLAFAILGYFVNRKSLFANICMAWVAFSFLILCVIGWGTIENGLILYTLYFSWAYISLVILLIEKIFQKLYWLRCLIYVVATSFFVIMNISGVLEVIRFGINYYPVL